MSETRSPSDALAASGRPGMRGRCPDAGPVAASHPGTRHPLTQEPFVSAGTSPRTGPAVAALRLSRSRQEAS